MEELNKKVALWITKKVGTMYMAYFFSVIGIGSLIGVITGNAFLGLFCGAVSSYFLQLVLLPVIMVGQNVQAEASERRMENIMGHISSEVDQLLENIKNK